jgi:formylglycine-generating enzyme required for sulfatase activity/tRNA A-37 threonylcarbamoyl transferase component Bud32
MQLQPGTLVLRGKYRIERLLGEGASAEVYLVALTRGQGQRALKILRRDLPGVGSTKINDYRSRFEREYDLQQQLLGNPRIIQAYDADDEDGSPALVMEYAGGGSLQDELDALTKRGERATPARCAEVLQEIALGLQAMHERGWVHRDVKPRNVLLERPGGRAKLGDLGVAETDQTRTRTDGQAWEHPGTPPYCSPEHANGLAYLTPAADVYALGVIGYRMLTGLVLAPATAGQAPVVIDGPAPEWLTGLIQRMLAWDYRERPQNGGAVAEAIARGQVIEREREAQLAARRSALRGQVEEALKAGQLVEADTRVDELLELDPEDLTAQTLARRVNRALVQEKQRWAREEARRQDDERQRLAAIAAEQKRMADEAERLKRQAEERERLAAVAAAEAERKPEAIQRLRRLSADRVALVLAPGVEMEFVRVPAGEFLMGSEKAKDSLAYDNELPQHRLKLPEYWIGRSPVTVAQFGVFANAVGHKTTAETVGHSLYWTGKWEKIEKADWGHPGGPATGVAQKQSHPVTHVSWYDGIAFCAWASKLGGGEVTLPSEAEWEKAARGMDGRFHPWGNEAPDDTRLNYNQNIKDTTPVGKYAVKGQSPYGCDDMVGNVWEWTRSLWGKDVSKPEFGYPYTTRQTEREDAQAGSDVSRVLRGGSFGDDARDVRCASRDMDFPGFHLGNLGFRVILRPPSFG